MTIGIPYAPEALELRVRRFLKFTIIQYETNFLRKRGRTVMNIANDKIVGGRYVAHDVAHDGIIFRNFVGNAVTHCISYS